MLGRNEKEDVGIASFAIERFVRRVSAGSKRLERRGVVVIEI